MNLRHFIVSNDSRKQHSDDDDEVSSDSDFPPSYYYIQNPSEGPFSEKTVDQRREIQRIPTFAIFHKLAVGKGIPHTFVGEFALLDNRQSIHVSS